MKRASGFLRIVLLVLLLAAVGLPVQAKITKVKDTGLANVALAPAVTGTWVKKGGSQRFLQEDGTWIRNRWIAYEGRIYYLDAKGKRTSGWDRYRGNTYFLRKNRGLVSGWLSRKGKQYYFGVDGAMYHGLQRIDGEQYYFGKKTGAAQSGWLTLGKHQYFFDTETYRMKKSCWVKTGKKHYYVGKKGKKRRGGWLTLGEKKYYLDTAGARVTGEQYIDGKGCFFKKNGVYDPAVTVEFSVDPAKPMVALTFDDGPGPYTGRLLDCLEKNHARATFFLVGTSMGGYASTVSRMEKLGCEIGSHSNSHGRFSVMSDYAIRQEVSVSSSSIRRACGKNPTVFRLPYGDGAGDQRVLNAIGLPSIYWSIDTRDWANTGNPQHTVSEVLDHVKNGDIVLMHDIHASSVAAAETIIPALIRRGYQLVTVSQLAQYKGKTRLKAGTTYRSF